MLRSCHFIEEHCLVGLPRASSSSAGRQKEGLMKIHSETRLLEGYYVFDFFIHGSWLPSSLVWTWVGLVSMFLVERRQSACFPVFSKEFCHSVGEGRNANFPGSGAARDEQPLPLLLPAKKPPLPVHLKPCPPSSFPEEMGRGMQTICEASTRDIDLPLIAPLLDKAGGWVITNFIS